MIFLFVFTIGVLCMVFGYILGREETLEEVKSVPQRAKMMRGE